MKYRLGFHQEKINSFEYQGIFGNNFVPLKDELIYQNLVLLQDNASNNRASFRYTIHTGQRGILQDNWAITVYGLLGLLIIFI